MEYSHTEEAFAAILLHVCVSEALSRGIEICNHMKKGKNMSEELQKNSWIFRSKRQPQARIRLFCFASAGGGASSYYPWVNGLAPEIEVCPVQLPGHENRMREPLFKNFDELRETLANVLLPVFDKPFAFFGHSMGALIAFGLTQYLQQQEAPMPARLFLSAYRSPQFSDEEPLSMLSDNQLIQKVQELNGPSLDVWANAELRQMLLPILRADCAICETYVSATSEPLDIPITVFGGLQDKRVMRTLLEPWREQTTRLFELHMLPGDHFFWYHNPGPIWQIIRESIAA
jgi:medium-chain acyl-[acyl-carrier-protein] hydrolase